MSFAKQFMKYASKSSLRTSSEQKKKELFIKTIKQ